MSVLFATALIMAVSAKKPPQPALPAAVRSDIEYAREMCRALGQRFEINRDYIETLDFNDDKIPDYIMDTRGYKCGSMTDDLFGSASGKPLYLYISKSGNKWEKVFSAYAYEYNTKRDYGQLPYFDVWIRGEVGYQVNYQRMQWTGKEMEIIEQEMGTTVPDQLWKNFD